MSTTNGTASVIQEFFNSPQDRVVSAFFLGAVLVCSTFLFVRAIIHNLLGYRLRRNARAEQGESLADRLSRLEANEELPADALRDALARALGGRAGVAYDEQAYNVRVVLVISFLGLASISQLVQLVDFPSGMDTACAFFTAFGDICVEAAYVSALYEISVELSALGVARKEVIPFRLLILAPLIICIASQGVATGIVAPLPAPFSHVSLCTRQRFVPLAAAIVALNFIFDIYAFIRLYWTLVPAFLLLRHRMEAMLDARFCWVLSLILFELLICVPNLIMTNMSAQNIPLSLGAICVLIAFTFRPAPEAPPSTASIPGSDAPTGRSTGRNIETASTGSKYPIEDYGREGYEEYKRRWSTNGSKSAPVPKRSSMRQPGGRERRTSRVSMQAPGEEPPVPVLPVQDVRTAPLGSFTMPSVAESSSEPPLPLVRASMPERPVNPLSPETADRIRKKRYRGTPVMFPRGSTEIQEAINAQAGPSVPRPLILPTMREKRLSSSGSSRRVSPKGSPKERRKPTLMLYIPPGSSAGETRPPLPRQNTNPSSILAVDDNHRRTPEADTPVPDTAYEQDIVAHRPSTPSSAQHSSRSTSSSLKSVKRRHRRSSTALAIVTRTSSGATQKRISIGKEGDVTIEIRQPSRRPHAQPTPRTTSLRHSQDHQPQPQAQAQSQNQDLQVQPATPTPLREAITSPKPRGPRQPPPGSARLAPREYPVGSGGSSSRRSPMLLGQLSFERRPPEGNWI